MNDSLTLPVIVGLAVGVAFIVLFSFSTVAFRDTVTGVTATGDLTITLADLNDEYALNEPLNFTINYRGDGYWCHDPTAKILDANSGEIAYDIPTLNLTLTCIPGEQIYTNNTWTLYDLMHPDTPVIIGKAGHYRVEIQGAGVLLEKDFVINNNLLSY